MDGLKMYVKLFSTTLKKTEENCLSKCTLGIKKYCSYTVNKYINNVWGLGKVG